MSRFALLLAIALASPAVRADEPPPCIGLLCSHVGIDGSLSWGLGKMGGPADTLPSRTMNTFAISAMPGYKIGAFMPGLLLQYRITGQNAAAADAGGSNLHGSGLLLGAGTTYRIAQRWMAQAAFDLFGSHSLSEPSASGQSATLKSPLGLQLGASYIVHPDYPATVDASFSYVTYRALSSGGTDLDISSNAVSHWSFALGITWHFGQPPIPKEKDEDPLVALQAAMALEMESEAENLFASTSTKADPTLLARFKSDLLFIEGQAELSDTASMELERMGSMLSRYPKLPFRVEAYTDNSGAPARNAKLTQARADAVRKALIKRGLSPSRVSAKGFGSTRPIASNATEEGRASNRRVEIHVGR